MTFYLQKIKDFVTSNTGYDQEELKKFQKVCSGVINSPYFNYNDLGKKVIKSLVQYKFLVKRISSPQFSNIFCRIFWLSFLKSTLIPLMMKVFALLFMNFWTLKMI